MLGADRNPRMEPGDIALQELAKDLNKEDEFKATNVSIFFGKPGETVPESVFLMVKSQIEQGVPFAGDVWWGVGIMQKIYWIKIICIWLNMKGPRYRRNHKL